MTEPFSGVPCGSILTGCKKIGEPIVVPPDFFTKIIMEKNKLWDINPGAQGVRPPPKQVDGAPAADAAPAAQD